ncbi:MULTISPECIES: hypothetical protein [Pseudomonas]|jgi:hypothetical protein|uniref:hypothetical protein n=1 Tax=Pseudomonas TaxID=286 RepID=UPI0008773E51|nr:MULTISPECIES: hypothetical protein [Pseudomonas]TFA86281.1 hypothetical protein F638_0873 [Pseudomonas sp. LAIL14HWK12:I2]SCZ27018.1 hypothetical protein SAMN03159313_2094 [Pseudomonas sp. NFIX46]SDB08383.1 hypothetical protein SAMN03097715_00637 [Pseudomonas putida]SFQ82794.1 hypothetical protein SAMN03159312_2476 [Pseudomonas sp. NFIX49]
MQFSFTQVTVGGFALVCAVATATWNMRNDRLAELTSIVEGYEKADKWTLPETIKRIDAASAHLDQKLSTIFDYEKLKVELSQARSDLSEKNLEMDRVRAEHDRKVLDLQGQVEVAKSDLKKKSDFLSSLYSDASEFSIAEHASKKISGLDMVVSVTSLYLNDSASVLVNNKLWNMYPGSVVSESFKGKDCKVMMNEITDYKLAHFTYVCEKKLE